MFKRSKKKRQAWFNNLTEEEKEAYFKKQQAKKAKMRQNRPDKTLAEPIINETNRESWKAKILSKNPWLERHRQLFIEQHNEYARDNEGHDLACEANNSMTLDEYRRQDKRSK